MNHLAKSFIIFVLLSYIFGAFITLKLRTNFLFLKFNVHILIYYNFLLKCHWFNHFMLLILYLKRLFYWNWEFYHHSSDMPISKNRILTWTCDYPLSKHSKTIFLSVLNARTSSMLFLITLLFLERNNYRWPLFQASN